MISIDFRLAKNSGIGRYINSISSKLKNKLDTEINILTSGTLKISSSEEKWFSRNIKIRSSYYSIAEQIEIPIKGLFNEFGTIWTPHYNFPVLYNGPKIVTVHDVAHLSLRDLFKSPSKQAYSKFMFRMLKDRADKVICVSNFTKQELIKYTSIDENKIEVVHNGLAEDWQQVIKEQDPHGHPFLLYVGNVKPHKNLKTLIQAFLKIKDKITHDLVLVGQKEGFLTKDKDVDKLVEQAPERIKFTGFISDDDLKQYYSFADLFAFPSLYEGFGYPPLEAMACGTPVLASNKASIPEVCGDAAIYFDPLNTEELSENLITVINNEGLKTDLINKGKQQSKKFTVEDCAQKTANVLKEFI